MLRATALRIGLVDQRARVACGQLAFIDVKLDRVGQLQQPQRIGDMAAALADDVRDVVLAVTVLVGQRLIAGRLFQRIQIGALDVFDDRKFKRFGVGDFEHDDRHFVQARALRGAPSPLAGDDLELLAAVRRRPHHDRLNDAALADRLRQFVELGIGEDAARVARIRR